MLTSQTASRLTLEFQKSKTLFWFTSFYFLNECNKKILFVSEEHNNWNKAGIIKVLRGGL